MNKLQELEHILNVFSKRILPAYLFQANPKKFLEWQGNICKQSAILSSKIIKRYLGDEYVKVEAWEGFFEHDLLGDYNHCWNYIIHKNDPKKNIICDMTSTITYMNYCDQNDPTLHIESSRKAVVRQEHFVKMIGSQEIDIDSEFSSPEFYTGLVGEDLMEDLTEILKYAKLWRDETNTILPPE